MERFEHVTTLRPVEVSRPGVLSEPLAPYLAVEATSPGELALVRSDDRLAVRYDAGGFSLAVTTGESTTTHRSRRSGKPAAPVERWALTLTGTRLAVLALEAGSWVVRGAVDLRGRLDPHDESWLAAVVAEGGELRGFGQLGLRDVRLVTEADGTPCRRDGALLVTATSAGPGFFDTAHTSVWSLDPAAGTLEHLSDLFLRRPDRPGVFGDHASHLLRDGDRWLLATSTWGGFDPSAPDATVAATLAETDTDLLTGRHVLDTRPLALPTTGLRSVGVWDPHLVRTPAGWLAAYVSARKFFRFHPVVAAGPTLEDLSLVGAVPRLKETEGVTLHHDTAGGADRWLLLASDGVGRRYPVWEVAADGLAALEDLPAPYPSNIPWPTLVAHAGDTWLIGFDGEAVGGRVAGYGTHGALHLARRARPARPDGA